MMRPVLGTWIRTHHAEVELLPMKNKQILVNTSFKIAVTHFRESEKVPQVAGWIVVKAVALMIT